MKGYRRDLETDAGIDAARRHGQRVHARGAAHQFTAEERAKGIGTQRASGRFGRGRFRPVVPSDEQIANWAEAGRIARGAPR